MSIIEDTFVGSNKPTTNNYSTTYLEVGNYNREIYIKISDLIPNQQYKLYLWCYNSPSSGTFNVYESLPFDPKTITYNTKVGNKSDTPIYTIPLGWGSKMIPFTPTSDTFYMHIDETTNSPITMSFYSIETGGPHLVCLFSTPSVLSHYSVDGIDYEVRRVSEDIISENHLNDMPSSYEVLFYLSENFTLYVSKDDGFKTEYIEKQYAELVSDNLNMPIYEPYIKIGPMKGYKIVRSSGETSVGSGDNDHTHSVLEKTTFLCNCQYLYIRACKINYV